MRRTGDRPILRVPPSCFAMGNLSPFQKGYGSLQLLSVCQKIPYKGFDDFSLTGLRRDNVTANAPGIFQELPGLSTESDLMSVTNDWSDKITSIIPASDPQIMFTVVDQGELDE